MNIDLPYHRAWRWISQVTDFSSLVLSFQRMSRVFDYKQFMFTGNGFYGIHVAWVPRVMYRDDGAGFGCDFFFQFANVDIQGSRFNIDKDRP